MNSDENEGDLMIITLIGNVKHFKDMGKSGEITLQSNPAGSSVTAVERSGSLFGSTNWSP